MESEILGLRKKKEKEKESKDLGIRMVWDPILLDVRCIK